MATLATLPLELLESVALRLSTKDRACLLCATKQLGACLSQCGALWEDATLSATSASEAQRLLPWLLRRRDQLRRLRLTLYFPGASEGTPVGESFWCSALLGAGLFGSRLRRLSLIAHQLELGPWLLALPELSCLTARGARVVVSPEFARLTALTSAVLVNCEAPLEGHDWDEEPDPLDICLPASLHKLQLRFSYLADDGYLPPAVGECTRLEQLRLSPALGDFQGLERLSALTDLTLMVSGRVPSELGALSALRQLCMTSQDIGDEQELDPLDPLLGLTCLEKLCLLDNMEGIPGDAGIMHCPVPGGLLALPLLKELHVRFAFPPPSLAPPPLHLTTLAPLEVLTLNLSTAAKSLPTLRILTSLTRLELSKDQCPEQPDAGGLSALLDTLGSSLGGLRWLRIYLNLCWERQGAAGMGLLPGMRDASGEEGQERRHVSGALAGPVGYTAKPSPPPFPSLQHLELVALERGPSCCPVSELVSVVWLPERITAMPNLKKLCVGGDTEGLCSVLAAAAAPGTAVENWGVDYWYYQ